MVRGKLPGTFISTAQRSGTAPSPISRAEAAGKSLTRSGVQVKMTETKSWGVSWFLANKLVINSITAVRISCCESTSICIAPRIARKLIGRFYLSHREFVDIYEAFYRFIKKAISHSVENIDIGRGISSSGINIDK